jgi:hypothetical protein
MPREKGDMLSGTIGMPIQAGQERDVWLGASYVFLLLTVIPMEPDQIFEDG